MEQLEREFKDLAAFDVAVSQSAVECTFKSKDAHDAGEESGSALKGSDQEEEEQGRRPGSAASAENRPALGLAATEKRALPEDVCEPPSAANVARGLQMWLDAHHANVALSQSADDTKDPPDAGGENKEFLAAKARAKHERHRGAIEAELESTTQVESTTPVETPSPSPRSAAIERMEQLERGFKDLAAFDVAVSQSAVECTFKSKDAHDAGEESGSALKGSDQHRPGSNKQRPRGGKTDSLSLSLSDWWASVTPIVQPCCVSPQRF
jgi:hypothetical protein